VGQQAKIATVSSSHEQSPESCETFDTAPATLERVAEGGRYTSVDSQRQLLQASAATSAATAGAPPSASHVAAKVAASPLGQAEGRDLAQAAAGGGTGARNLRHTVPARVLLGAVAELGGASGTTSPTAAAAAVAAAAQLRMHGAAATYKGRPSVNHTTL